MMTIKSLALALSLALLPATTNAWFTCTFPDVGWMAIDEGIGKSATYAVAAMNGNMYAGGYHQGNFVMMGVTDTAPYAVSPAPGAALWGSTNSELQSLYISETDASGSMTKSWNFQGFVYQRGQIGHSGGKNNIKFDGLRAFRNQPYLAVNAEYLVQLNMPDGTVYQDSNSVWHTAFPKADGEKIPLIMKLDTTSVNGTGPGTAGWSKEMDAGCPGGAVVHSVDGAGADDGMIVSYKCCQTYDADASRGRKMGACTERLTKLSGPNPADVEWNYEQPHELKDCETDQNGHIYCGFTVETKRPTQTWMFGTFPITTTNTSETTIGIVVFNTTGGVVWAKKTDANTGFNDLDVSSDGQTLAVVGGCGCGGTDGKTTRINTTTGGEGGVMWQDESGVGTHGFRQVAVTDDGQIAAFGQLDHKGTTNDLVLKDQSGSEFNIRSTGSYDVFALVYTPDGVGEFVIDGGGTGMDYFLALAVQPTENKLYVGGYTRSPKIRWGGVTYDNPMANGDQNSPSGSNKANVAQIAWGSGASFKPDCLSTCVEGQGVREDNIASDKCFIDGYCYNKDESSPYELLECYKCDPSVSKMEWDFANPSEKYCHIKVGSSGHKCVDNHEHPETWDGVSRTNRGGPVWETDWCSVCDVSRSTTAYSDVPGCKLGVTFHATPAETASSRRQLQGGAPSAPSPTPYSGPTVDMASNIFTPSCFHSDGSPVMMGDTPMTSAQCLSDHNALQACNAKDCMDTTVAIALIVVVSVTLGLVLVMLAVVVSKERSGNPLFAPLNSGPPQSQSAGSNTKENF